MKKRAFFILFVAFFYGFIGVEAQSLQLLKQVKLSKWGIPSGDYSGITYLGNDRYAVVSDKQDNDGFYEFYIHLNEETGRVEDVKLVSFHQNANIPRDAEDICYVSSTGTVFIASEDDQRIIEYDTFGQRTGRELAVPTYLGIDKIHHNYGFEALSYSDETALFWTCTESCLKTDGDLASLDNPKEVKVCLQPFNSTLQPLDNRVTYFTDKPSIKSEPKQYAFGVPAMTALDDGRLLVLEREFFVAQNYLGSYVTNKVFLVDPNDSVKKSIGSWTTKLNLTKRNIANYEGMCLGPKLKDGRQTILFISDSQGGFGNSLFHLKDYLRVGIICIEAPL